MDKRVIELAKSDFAESFLHLNGKILSLDDYPHLRAIYNLDHPKIVLQFSRQTAKSTTLANMMVTNSILTPYFKTLYISPSVDQTKVFSHDRVAPIMDSSPFVKKHYLSPSIVQNVFMKQLLNGSRMYLRYAYLDADRIRGYSADMNLFDEMQDQMEDNIGVIEETMSRSEYKYSMYVGTPKRSRGPLADRWEDSSKNEWMPKCEHCGKWNLLDEDNIGLNGLICKKCGGELSAKRGQWVSTGSKGPELEGFRVCLLHFHDAPWVDWKRDIIDKRERQSKALFYNETLALSYDAGITPITKDQLREVCTGGEMSAEPTEYDKQQPCFLGIDYGPVNSEKSFTTISIVRMENGIPRILYAKKYMGKQAEYSFIHDDIPELFKKWNCTHIASDYGMGEASNSEFRKRLGVEKVISFQHLPNQKELVRWNAKLPAYTLNRTQVMANFFSDFEKGNIILPKWDDNTDTFMQDILNIQIDYNEDTNVMRYINTGPDDFYHATLFAALAGDLYHEMGNFQSF